VTNLDDETAGVTVSPNPPMETTEGAGTATFTVVLESEPTETVTIDFLNIDETEGTVAPAALTFDAGNWDDAQTVTVTGEDDDLDDGDIEYTIDVTPSSLDNNYDSLPPEIVSVTNLDDDTAGMIVNPTSGLVTDEGGGTATFTVTLTSESISFVDINFVTLPPESDEGIATPNPITFIPAEWNIPQTVTVTGLNDFVVDGDVSYTIQATASSPGDGNYDVLAPVDVSLTNQDDDVAGITVDPIDGLITTEGGGFDSFTVVLDSEPAADVTIAVSSSDLTEGTVSTGSLTFTALDWDTPQPVTVTGINDFVVDGDIIYTIVTGAAVSADPLYGGMASDDVSVTNSDDDAVGITIAPTAGLETDELGATDSFTVVLDSEPTASVTINLSSSNEAEGTVSPESLTFTAGNWDLSQTVTITGVDDDVDDEDVGYTILTDPAISDDPNFSGVNPIDPTVTNVDDDLAGVTITSTLVLITTEAGITDTFTVVLDTEPVASVDIVLTSSDLTEGTVPPSPLTFTSTDWNIPQIVTVTGVNDYLDDGDIPYNIQLSTDTGDELYAAITLDDVSVTNIDDDGVGITVDPLAGLSTTEAGGSDTFTIVLTSQPTADVDIDLSSSNTSEGTVTSPVPLTFTSGNWNIAQTVTVTGVDDLVDDDDIPYTIITEAATSDDDQYDGLVVADVRVTNLNDDHTPVAEPDTYITNQDIFTVSEPGVLGNDSDANGQDTMVAILDDNVDNGSLTFHPDGSFEYTADLTFGGEDGFTYWVTDGANNSLTAQVTIIVDRVAPTVEWINDERLDVTNEIVQLAANANDNYEIEYIKFYRWDPYMGDNGDFVEIGRDYTYPYSIDLDTSTLNFEFNQVFSRAYDTAGNRSERHSIWIYRDYYYLYMPLIFP